jgi:hypothetical protein
MTETRREREIRFHVHESGLPIMPVEVLLTSAVQSGADIDDNLCQWTSGDYQPSIGRLRFKSRKYEDPDLGSAMDASEGETEYAETMVDFIQVDHLMELMAHLRQTYTHSEALDQLAERLDIGMMFEAHRKGNDYS